MRNEQGTMGRGASLAQCKQSAGGELQEPVTLPGEVREGFPEEVISGLVFER